MDEKLFLHIIINCESVKHMWKNLESIYEQKSDNAVTTMIQLSEGTGR